MKKKFELLWLLYAIAGLLSIFFISCFWIDCMDDKWKTVLMSAGASLIGAVLLGVFIEMISNKKKNSAKNSIFAESISIAEGTIEELDNLFEVFKQDKDIPITFTNDQDFINKSMDYYLSLTAKTNETNEDKLSLLRSAIEDDIRSSFIIEYCRYAVRTFETVINSKNFLLTEGFITEDEFKNFVTASARMKFLVNESEERNKTTLLSNTLNFREFLIKIIDLKSK